MNVNMQVTTPDVQNYADMTTGFRNGSAVGNSGFADLLIKTGKSDDKLMNADSSAKSRISNHMTSVTSRQQRSSRLSGTDRASGRNRSAETAKTDSTVSWGQQSTDAAVISASMQTQADVRQHEKADAAGKAVQQVDATGSTASVQAAETTDPSQEMQTSQQTADMQMAGMQDAQADPSQDVQSAQQMQLTQAAQQMSQTADRQMMQGAAEAADPTQEMQSATQMQAAEMQNVQQTQGTQQLTQTADRQMMQGAAEAADPAQEMQSATQMQAAEMQNVQQTQGTQPADMQLMQGTADAAEDPSQEMQSTAQTHAAQMQNMQQTQSTQQLSKTTDRQMMQGAAEAVADPSQEMQSTAQTHAAQMQNMQQTQSTWQLSETTDRQMMQGTAEAAADPSQEMQNTVLQMQTSQQMQDAQQLSQTADAQNAATADLAQGTQSTQQLQAAQTQTAGTQQTPSAQQNSIRQYDVSEAQMTDAAAAENVAKTAQPEKKESFRSGTEEQDADSSAAFGKKTASEEPEIVNAAEAQLRSDSLFAKDMSAAGSTQTAEVSTTREAMTEDIADYLAAHFPQKNGTFQIELNPQNLGRVMIRVVYETGRAVVSIAASQADTMRMLSQNAQQMGNILRDATGEETTVVVPETSAQNQQDNATNTEARSQNRREADESPDHDKNRRSQSDEFLNRMRLGIV